MAVGLYALRESIFLRTEAQFWTDSAKSVLMHNFLVKPIRKCVSTGLTALRANIYNKKAQLHQIEFVPPVEKGNIHLPETLISAQIGPFAKQKPRLVRARPIVYVVLRLPM